MVAPSVGTCVPLNFTHFPMQVRRHVVNPLELCRSTVPGQQLC